MDPVIGAAVAQLTAAAMDCDIVARFNGLVRLGYEFTEAVFGPGSADTLMPKPMGIPTI